MGADMTGSSKPIRLDASLVEEAIAEAARKLRTPPKQIEFWIRLGKAIDGLLSLEEIMALRGGLVHIEPTHGLRADPDEVFDDLESRRNTLSRTVTSARVVYQASREHPGYLEQIHPDGSVVVGRFEGRDFVALAA